MTQITARLPPELVAPIDRAAARLDRSRAQIVRQAIEYYLEDVDDASDRTLPGGLRRRGSRLLVLVLRIAHRRDVYR